MDWTLSMIYRAIAVSIILSLLMANSSGCDAYGSTYVHVSMQVYVSKT